MWRCVNCETEIEDKYPHCWHCGVGHAPQTATRPASQPATQPAPPLTTRSTPQSATRPGAVAQSAVPGFASYEELAKVPSRSPWVFRRGPLQRIFFYALVLTLFKVLGSPFLGAYGTYIVAVVGVVMLVVILWRFFRHDPTEGVGINLH
jgi:hypothetical protein